MRLAMGMSAAACFAALGAAGYVDENITATDAAVVRYETDDGCAYAFTNPAAGTVSVTVNRLRKLSRYLVVGGGGSGGPTIGGGGGGGGVVPVDDCGKIFVSGAKLSVSVGAGGKRSNTASDRRGGDTVLAFPGQTVTAYGGGGGNGWNAGSGTTGASTGGSTSNNGGGGANPLDLDPPQGHCGGRSVGGINYGIGCGGGGYGEAGGNSYKSTRTLDDGTVVEYAQGGKGGDGCTNDITGVKHVYGSGGGGAAGWSANVGGNNVYNLPGAGGAESGGRGGHTTLDHGNTNLYGDDGVDGMGGGGGGEGHGNGSTAAGLGGSGCVILRFVDLSEGDKAFQIAAIPDQTPTGSALTPSVTVQDAVTGAVLTENTHYTVAYADNLNPGTATVTVTGKGGSDYEGVSATANFTILHSRRGGKDVYLFLGGANMCAGAQAGGPAAAVSNIMANAEADAEVVIVNAAVSASTLATWSWGQANYMAAMTAAKAAVAAGGSIRAIFWMQGEEDAATESVRTAYAATLAGIVAALREDLSLSDSIPFVAATLPETSSTGVVSCRALNENLRTLPDALTNAYVVESRDLMLNAYNVKLLCAESTRTLGLRMANAFFEHERRYARQKLVLGALGPQALSGDDVIAPAVTVTDADGATVAADNYDVTYRGVSVEGFGVAVVVGKAGTDYAGSTNFAPFRVMAPVFAASDGDADADGSSWAAATTFDHAVTLADGAKEVWLKKGTYAWTAAYSMTVSMFVRGGFEGVAGDRNDGEYSIFDGSRTISAILTGTHTGNPAAATYKTYIERIDFRGATGNLIYHPGSGVAQIRACRFSNASTGISVGAAYGQQEFAVRDCQFYNIICGDTTWGGGRPLSFGNVVNSLVENCSFLSNGVPWSYAIPANTLYGQGRLVVGAHDVIGCEFRANRMTASVGNGSYCLAFSPSRRLRVEHCLFAGNELIGRGITDSQWGGSVNANADSGMIVLSGGSASAPLEIFNCTFAYNTIDNGSAATLSVTKGCAIIRNTIFFGNISSSGNLTGSDIVLQTNSDSDTATADIAHSLFAEDSDKFFYPGRQGTFTMDRTTMVFGDPLFVTPQTTVTNLIRNTTSGVATTSATRWRSNFAYTVDSQPTVAAFDLHLRSAAGTRLDDGTWRKFEGEASPALDKGDPDADCRAEPKPNGGRINIGYYGGTAGASKTLEAFPGVYGGIVGITFPDGVSQPQVDFAIEDTEGGTYTGDVTVYVGTGDVWTVSNTYASVASGTRFRILVPDCYPPGSTLRARVVISAGGKTVSVTSEKTVEGRVSPYYGVGGGATVFHVRPGATGRGDGSDWFHAFDGDIHDAVRHVTKQGLLDVTEVWCAMKTNTLTETKSGLSPTQALAVRGGFEGLETSAAARAGWRTVCTGGGVRTPMAAANTSAAQTLGRVALTGGAGRGFEKSGMGDLTLADCRFFGNIKSGSIDGRGVYATGTAGTTVLAITNCVFEGNANTDLGTFADVYSGSGGALYVQNFRRVCIDDSLFLTNGLVWNVSHPRSGNARMAGGAVYATGAPLTVRRTVFRGNRCGTSRSSGYAGIVALQSGTAGSAFTNCLFAGNSESWHADSGPGPYGGAIKVVTGDTNTAVVVSGCTFFGNLSDGTSVAAGVTVASGAVRVENSLFNGNLLGGSKSGEYAADLVVAADAVADVRYTLFSAADAVCAQSGGTLALGPGVRYGDAKLVTPTSETEGIVQQTDGCTVFKPAVRAAVLGWNVHLRGIGGYRDERTLSRVSGNRGERSPALDAADPAAPFAGEPKAGPFWHGRRANLGCYGNTPWATLTPQPGVSLSVR